MRFLDIDAPEFATSSIEMLYEFQPGDMGGPFCLAFGRERPEQRRHPIDQLLAIDRENGKGGGPLPVCYFLRGSFQEEVPVTELDGLWIGCVQLSLRRPSALSMAAMIS